MNRRHFLAALASLGAVAGLSNRTRAAQSTAPLPESRLLGGPLSWPPPAVRVYDLKNPEPGDIVPASEDAWRLLPVGTLVAFTSETDIVTCLILIEPMPIGAVGTMRREHSGAVHGPALMPWSWGRCHINRAIVRATRLQVHPRTYPSGDWGSDSFKTWVALSERRERELADQIAAAMLPHLVGQQRRDAESWRNRATPIERKNAQTWLDELHLEVVIRDGRVSFVDDRSGKLVPVDLT